MRILPLCLAGATLLVSAAASAEINPSNETYLSPDATEIAGEVVVQARDLSASDLRDLKREYGLHSASSWSDDHDEIEVGDVLPPQEEAFLDKLRHDSRVLVAERQHILRASAFVPNDPLYDKQWALPRIGAPTSYDYTVGTNIWVAVVDTGVDCSLPDFDKSNCKSGYNFADNNSDTTDRQSHGSFCASEINEVMNNKLGAAGLSPGATVLAVKALSDEGWGSSSSVASSIDYAVDQGVQVISMSLGSHQPDKLIEAACKRAVDAHITVVAAAGNESGPVGWPAAFDGVLAISATDSNDNIAKFSCRGPEVFIGSPGIGIINQTIDGHGGVHYPSYNGTSMSAPWSSSAAALLSSLGLRGDAIKSALANNADKKDDANLFGAGILNAGKAVSHTYWSQFIYRTIALFFLAFITKRKINSAGGTATKPGTLGMLFASTGLLPMLPIVGWLPRLRNLRWLGELSMKPFGMWDTLYSSNLHNWLPLASAIPVILLLVVGYGIKSFRSTIGGFGIGTAALLTQLIIQNDGDWSLLFRGWMIVNAVVALWCARTVLDSKVNDTTTTVRP